MRNVLGSFALFLFTSAGLKADALADLLAKMDQAAPSFKNISAELTRSAYTKVIDDTTKESGTILLRRKSARELEALVVFTKPDPKTVALSGKKAEIFYPKLKTVQEYDLGKDSGLVDQFLMLGFGTTGKDLAGSYTIKYAGEESVAGRKTHRLELTPKNPKVREKLTKLELWMAETGAFPVQQKMVEPSGNANTFTYSDVKANGAIAGDAFKLKLPKGVKREYPQK